MSIENFSFYNPTRIIYKAGSGAEIADYIAKDKMKSVLLVYGQQAIKKIGLYDKIVDALKKQNIKVFELAGVRANPEITKVIEGIDISRKNGIECVLAVGGGSTYDTSKAIIVGSKFPADVPSSAIWECYEGTRPVLNALPLYGVLTISATGSEMNDGGVVQDDKQKKKWCFNSEFCFPRVSIVDPSLQANLPWNQQVNGFVDAIVHTLEFLTNIDDPESVETTFAIDISIIKSIIKSGDKLMKNPNDYNARANFCWAATCGLNQITGVAMKGGCWAVHFLEHAMGAVNPKVSHGAGLGVAFPAFVRANAEKGLRLKQYERIAKEVYGKEGWQGLIEGFQAMLKRWGHPTSLNELFGKEMKQADRDELLAVFMKRPVGGYWPEGTPEEIARTAYKYM